MTTFDNEVRDAAARRLITPSYWLEARPKFCHEIALLAARAQRDLGDSESIWTDREAAHALASQFAISLSLSDDETTVDQMIDSTITATLFRQVTAPLTREA